MQSLVEQSCPFAFKSGGHAPFGGWANIGGDGVTIDLSGLSSSVTLSADRAVASVGAGLRWIDVYRYLDEEGLAVAGGRNGDVGVGGLTTGGGISYFGPRVGWTCDTVVNFEVRGFLLRKTSRWIILTCTIDCASVRNAHKRQRDLPSRNLARPERRRLQFRYCDSLRSGYIPARTSLGWRVSQSDFFSCCCHQGLYEHCKRKHI